MTDAHKRDLLYTYSQAKEKTFTLKGFVNPGGNEDVHDPFGGDLETYRHTFNELSNVLETVKRKLMEGQVE